MTAAADTRPDETRSGTTRAPGSTRWLPVGLALFTVAWGGNQFTPLMVMYRELGGFSTAVVDVLLGAYVLGIVPGMLVGGPLSDRLGRKPLMLAAPPLAILSSLVLALGGDAVPVLFLGRVLAGLALGIAMAVGSTWISELSSLRGGAGSGAARAAMSLTLGFLLGPVAAGLLAQWARPTSASSSRRCWPCSRRSSPLHRTVPRARGDRAGGLVVVARARRHA